MRVLKVLGKDPMFTMAIFAVAACLIKFLMEGVAFTVEGYNISLGHADSLTYAAILGPVLGAHGYIQVSGPKKADAPTEEGEESK